ncbi:hypothetical protein NMG60_11015936 [Bertholletia excelsa]
MSDSEIPLDEIAEQIEWERVFHSLPDDSSLLDSSMLSDLSSSSPAESFALSLVDIERLLMMDNNYGDDARGDKLDDDQQPSLEVCNDFWSDFLLDSPVGSDRAAEVVDLPEGDAGAGKHSNSSSASEEDEQKKIVTDDTDKADVVDPLSKKRQRQVRNRDAAVRSRERKKMYVRDLEMKSKYLEGECRRLGTLLQCCFAENQALRLSLQNSRAYDASMTKQESAVLPLESLLLGSLLWFLGIICLVILPRPVNWILEAVPEENVDEKNQLSLGRRKAGSKVFGSYMVSKRCKASRRRMKPSLPVVKKFVFLLFVNLYGLVF